MKQILKTKFGIRMAPFMMAGLLLFSSSVAQPVQAVSFFDAIKCNALSLFATATKATLQISHSAMTATFQLSLSVLQTTWQLEDQATAALRSISESAFTALIGAFEKTPGLGVVQKAAIIVFKDLLLKSVHLLETNIDAGEAAYREDMLALVKAHEKALGEMVDTLIQQINDADAAALANCSNAGVVANLTAVIAGATATLLAKSLILDAQSIAKAINIELTRDTLFVQQDLQFVGIATDAVAKLTKVILTGSA